MRAGREGRVPRRLRSRLTLCAVLAAALGVAAWYLGMDAAHAIGLGAAALALTGCLSALGESAPVSWPREEPPLRPGSRRDVVQLGWSLGGRGGRASGEGVRRLRLIAARALTLRGIDLDDPAAAPRVTEFLGPEAALLLRRGAATTARTAEVRALLDRLDAMTAGPSAARHGPPAATASAAPTTPHPDEDSHAR